MEIFCIMSNSHHIHTHIVIIVGVKKALLLVYTQLVYVMHEVIIHKQLQLFQKEATFGHTTLVLIN